jgi:hypothetical protein
MRLDTAGQVLGANLVGENYIPNTLVGPYRSSNTQLIRSGKSFYMVSNGSWSLSLQPGISYGYKVVRIDSSYQASWVEGAGGQNVPIYYYNAPAPYDGVAIGGNERGPALTPYSLGMLFSLKKIDSSGSNPDASCYLGKQLPVVVPLTVSMQPTSWTSDVASAYLSVPRPMPLENFYPEMRFKCPDYVDSCSYLKLTGTSSVCNLAPVYTYKSHKNKACGQPTQWQVSPGVQIISQTDTAISVRFPAFGRFVIYVANPLSCAPVLDSLVVTAKSNTLSLDLGPDQQICPQNSTLLHAGPAFLSYEWQDGSTDSVFLASQPGQYWVEVMDSCGNVLRDAIDISLAPPIPFYAGPDRVKCNNDTIHLQAPPGFINYSWSPPYNMNVSSGPNITVNPQTDTSYMVMAEASPGCFAYDTIRIQVIHSPRIDLGADKSFCQGDSVVFDAGAGFVSYNWSTGISGPQLLAAHTAGEYSVVGTTEEGCRSYDTVKVLQVFPSPAPQLDQNPVICAGTTRVLDAGGVSQPICGTMEACRHRLRSIQPAPIPWR